MCFTRRRRDHAEFLLFTRDAGFQQERSFNSRKRRAQTLDQFDSRYEFAEFPVRIYYDTCSSQSADHYSGTYVDPEGSHFRIRSQSTCLDVRSGSVYCQWLLPVFSRNGFVVLLMEDVFIHFLPQFLVFLRASNRC